MKREHHDYIPKLIICSMGFIILSIVLFILGYSNLIDNLFVLSKETSADKSATIITIKSILTNIASVLIVSGIYNIYYEFSIRNSMFHVIRRELNIKENIDAVGIDEVLLDIDSINYSAVIKNVKKNIDILHSYGGTWNRNNFSFIEEQFKENKIHIRVVLLSPKSDLINGLYELYNKESVEDLLKSMKKSIELWLELEHYKKVHPDDCGEINIYYHKENPTHSSYRFDDCIMNVSNTIHSKRTTNLPTILCRKNTKVKKCLYSIYKEEFELVLESAKAVTSENYMSFFEDDQETDNTEDYVATENTISEAVAT